MKEKVIMLLTSTIYLWMPMLHELLFTSLFHLSIIKILDLSSRFQKISKHRLHQPSGCQPDSYELLSDHFGTNGNRFQ